jgi:hypothetical protein
LFVWLFVRGGEESSRGKLFFMRVLGEARLHSLSPRALARQHFEQDNTCGLRRAPERPGNKASRESVLLPRSAMTTVKPISPAEFGDSGAFLCDFAPAPIVGPLAAIKLLFLLMNICGSSFPSNPPSHSLLWSIA